MVSTQNFLKPRRLQKGDKIGIANSASPVNADELAAGVAYLELLGYLPIVGENVLKVGEVGQSFLAGTDAERASDMNDLFRRDDIAAIICARGGYGSMRLTELLDWNALRDNPKILTGYSDVTSLHLGINQISGLTSIHGKMATNIHTLAPEPQALFWEMLTNPNPYGALPANPESITTLVSGMAEGVLAGGCLTLLAHACGTRIQPDFRGKIVLIEDVGELIYRCDRYLAQLLLCGVLQEAAGFVIGTVTTWYDKDETPPPPDTPESLWRAMIAPLGKPTICGFPFGHEPNPLTLPLGVHARLDADNCTLTLLESPIS